MQGIRRTVHEICPACGGVRLLHVEEPERSRGSRARYFSENLGEPPIDRTHPFVGKLPVPNDQERRFRPVRAQVGAGTLRTAVPCCRRFPVGRRRCENRLRGSVDDRRTGRGANARTAAAGLPSEPLRTAVSSGDRPGTGDHYQNGGIPHPHGARRTAEDHRRDHRILLTFRSFMRPIRSSDGDRCFFFCEKRSRTHRNKY